MITRSPVSATLTFTALNLKRVLRDWSNLVFSCALPVIFYLIFGAAQNYGPSPFEDGDWEAFVMIGLALYGGATGTVAHAGMSVVEHRTGWGRQLALTPMTTSRLLVSHAMIILFRAALPVAAVFIAGVLTGVEMSAGNWAITFLLTALLTLPFGFYGLAWSMLIPGENTISIATTSVVMLAFAGTVLWPLSESLTKLAAFTPMYGPAVLARYPVAEGTIVVQGDLYLVEHPIAWAIINLVVWTTILVTAVALLSRRDKERV